MPDKVGDETAREAPFDEDVAPLDLALEPVFHLGALWIEPGATMVVDAAGARRKLEPKVMLVLVSDRLTTAQHDKSRRLESDAV